MIQYRADYGGMYKIYDFYFRYHLWGRGYFKVKKQHFERSVTQSLSIYKDGERREQVRFMRRMKENDIPFAYEQEFSQECYRFENFSRTNVAISDILETQDEHQLVLYARSESIMKVLMSEEFAVQFPVFREILRKRLSSYCYRSFVTKRVSGFFFHLSTMEGSQLPELPIDCADLIFEHLANADLINLRKTYSMKNEVLSKLWKTAKSRLTLRQSPKKKMCPSITII